jgi:phosphatidylglycerophosphate synthase
MLISDVCLFLFFLMMTNDLLLSYIVFLYKVKLDDPMLPPLHSVHIKFVNQWIAINWTFQLWCLFPYAEIDCIMFSSRFQMPPPYQGIHADLDIMFSSKLWNAWECLSNIRLIFN